MIDHLSRAKKAWPILVGHAEKGEAPFTYGELAKKLSLHHRAVGYFLSIIQDFCRDRKLPPLQALVVNKQTRLPGYGYKGSKITHNKHAEVLKDVYKFNWSKIDFD